MGSSRESNLPGRGSFRRAKRGPAGAGLDLENGPGHRRHLKGADADEGLAIDEFCAHVLWAGVEAIDDGGDGGSRP